MASLVKMEGNVAQGLTDALGRYADTVKEKVLFSGVAAMANVIYDEVKLNVSRHSKTGLLESAVYRVYSPERSTEDEKTYRVSVNKSKAPHWHFLEYGTSKQPATPYIRPAFDHIGRAIAAGQARMTQRLGEVSDQ